jgi:di/tricarboxylate transporter
MSDSRLRNFGDLFNPSRAGISEAVVPPTSRFIGKTAGELRLRKQPRASACWRSTATSRCCARTCASKLRAGDMLVFHSIWRDLAQAAKSRDFVVVTDYPKGEQRPHKFKIAMIDLRAHHGIALSSHHPGA